MIAKHVRRAEGRRAAARALYECIKGGLTEGEPVARVDADHFAFHLVERQRSAVLEQLRQIERRIRRLSDKMGVIHLVPRFGISRCARGGRRRA